MTLLSLKPSTRDMDFTGPSTDIADFEKAHSSLHHGFQIDCWKGGQVFMINLPADYIQKSRRISTRLNRISLYALSPLDIIVTKIARLNNRDIEDIETCIRQL